MPLADTYRAYLDVLNNRQFDELFYFVHDHLTYNGERLTRADYANMIAADIEAAPDLFYDPQIIVATTDQIACRLVFSCAPEREFLGFTPDGRRLTFAEHAFYDFHNDRITAVTSLIDRDAIREQLSRAP
jgi:predicted ester cyclase